MGFANRKSFSNIDFSLDLYLREISGYTLLTRREEAELAMRIRKGDDGALEKLIRSNLRYGVSVATRYVNQGVSLLDLINEGNLGLIRAAYDTGSGTGTF